MKKIGILASILLFPVFSMAADTLKTEDEKTLYSLGTVITKNLKQFEITKEEAKFIIMGFTDAINGEKSKVDDSYLPKINDFFAKKNKEMVEREKLKSDKFVKTYLKKNKKAKKFDSGLVYLKTKSGKGKKPKAIDTVKVHYHGTFMDGKVFDSSVERKTPSEFPLNAVIACWTEGLQKMKIGEKATLVCPSDIAYGDAGRPPHIAPGTTLLFDVELLEIISKKETLKAKTKTKVKK